MIARGGVSSSADDDQRYAALDPRHLLKKVDENFSQKSFLVGSWERDGLSPDRQLSLT